jgi:hypothetical protein
MGTVGILNLFTRSAESTMVVQPESTRILLAGFFPMVPLKMKRESDLVEIAISKNFPKCAGTLDQLEKHWQLSDGLLFYYHRLFIPEQFEVI